MVCELLYVKKEKEKEEKEKKKGRRKKKRKKEKKEKEEEEKRKGREGGRKSGKKLIHLEQKQSMPGDSGGGTCYCRDLGNDSGDGNVGTNLRATSRVV